MSGFLGAFVAVIAMVLWLGGVMLLGFRSMEAYSLRSGLLNGVGAVVLFAAGMALVFGQSDGEMEQCLRAGRAWAIVGSHREMRFNAATKTSHMETVTDYGCVDRR